MINDPEEYKLKSYILKDITEDKDIKLTLRYFHINEEINVKLSTSI